MPMAHLTVMAGAALLTFVAGSSAILTAQPRRAPSTAPLLPLSERDVVAASATPGSANASGCECTFTIGRRTLAYAAGERFMVRTAGGRQICRIQDVQTGMGTNDRATAICAGMGFSFRRTGRVHHYIDADSADWPATLTLTRGRQQRTLVGRLDCGC